MTKVAMKQFILLVSVLGKMSRFVKTILFLVLNLRQPSILSTLLLTASIDISPVHMPVLEKVAISLERRNIGNFMRKNSDFMLKAIFRCNP